MKKCMFEVLFLDFYGTVTGGDRQAVEDTSAQIVDDLGLSMGAAEFSEAWGRFFFTAADDRNHHRFANLYRIECESLIATLESLDRRGVDPAPYVNSLQAYWSDPTIQPEAAEALAKMPIPICLVSNADTEDLLTAVERHSLRFDHIITSEDARCYKPDPAIFEKALAAMSVAPDRVIHAGDSLHADVNGADPLGITTAWVCREGRIFDVGEKEPDHKVSCLKELGTIIDPGH